MAKQNLDEYDFSDLCEDIKRMLPANLHSTKESNNFMWIATKNYDIGVYPLHYEIRLQDECVFAEIHCESDATITYGKGKNSKDFSIEFQSYCTNKGYIPVANGNRASYQWYRKTNVGVKFEEGCAVDVLNHLKDLIDDSRDDLLAMMEKILS